MNIKIFQRWILVPKGVKFIPGINFKQLEFVFIFFSLTTRWKSCWEFTPITKVWTVFELELVLRNLINILKTFRHFFVVMLRGYLTFWSTRYNNFNVECFVFTPIRKMCNNFHLQRKCNHKKKIKTMTYCNFCIYTTSLIIWKRIFLYVIVHIFRVTI